MGKCEKTPDKITITCDCGKYVHTLTKVDNGEPQYNSAMAKKKDDEPAPPIEPKDAPPVKKKKGAMSWLFEDVNAPDDDAE